VTPESASSSSPGVGGRTVVWGLLFQLAAAPVGVTGSAARLETQTRVRLGRLDLGVAIADRKGRFGLLADRRAYMRNLIYAFARTFDPRLSMSNPSLER